MITPTIHRHAVNFNEVTVGRILYYFSYDTIVGFQVGGNRPVVRENIWGPTTGKHINRIRPGTKEGRLPTEEFFMALDLAQKVEAQK